MVAPVLRPAPGALAPNRCADRRGSYYWLLAPLRYQWTACSGYLEATSRCCSQHSCDAGATRSIRREKPSGNGFGRFKETLQDTHQASTCDTSHVAMVGLKTSPRPRFGPGGSYPLGSCVLGVLLLTQGIRIFTTGVHPFLSPIEREASTPLQWGRTMRSSHPGKSRRSPDPTEWKQDQLQSGDQPQPLQDRRNRLPSPGCHATLPEVPESIPRRRWSWRAAIQVAWRLGYSEGGCANALASRSRSLWSCSHLGSHSLRFGGASALWAAYKDASVVRRYGRWASDAFHTYLWEDREYSRGMSESMIKTSLTPT